MNTGNRILWTVIGLLLVGLGVVGLLVNLGRMPGTTRSQPLLWPELLQQWRTMGGWALGATVVVGLLLACLGATLLRAQLRRHGSAPMPDLDFVAGSAGHTHVATSVVTRGLAHDLESHPEIKQAAAHLSGELAKPKLNVWLTVEPGANLRRVQERVSVALKRFAETTSLHPAQIAIEAKLAGGEVRRLA